MAFETLDWIIVGSIFLLFFIVAAVVSFVILNRLRWNWQYVDIDSNGNIIKRGRARLISFGDGGEEIFFLKGLKKYRVAYGKRIGKNQIAWQFGSDGYPYNISFGQIDKRLLEAGVIPVDRDMRYAYASVRKGIEKRFDDRDFMQKYGTIIAFGMLFLCIIAMAGFLWVGFNGQKDITTAQNEGMKTMKEVLELLKQVLANIDNIKTGGTGITPVTPPVISGA